jgi:predicted DNA-binding protein (MmcQ/YjbR family)
MTNEEIRNHCLSLPHVTEVVRWGDHLLFKVGGKMFAIIELDGHSCAFKCTPERYAELVEMEDVVPSSHNMWKHQWVTTETLTALPRAELRDLLTESYRLVRASLPRKVQAAMDGPSARGPAPAENASRQRRDNGKPVRKSAAGSRTKAVSATRKQTAG